MIAATLGDVHNDRDMVLIHGWGLHGGIWSGLLPILGRKSRPTAPDLPGHGSAPPAPGGLDLNACADALAGSIGPGATVLGWSLGGMVAIRLATRHPDRVGTLVLVGTTPKFVAGPGWDCGLDPAVIDGFARDLAIDYRGTLNNFLTLQVRGSDDPRAVLRQLRAALFARGEPSAETLADGLGILARADLREEVAAIRQPVRVIAGERDRLVPVAASRWLAVAVPQGTFVAIAGAAHAPFLSHPEAFVRALASQPAPRRSVRRQRARR